MKTGSSPLVGEVDPNSAWSILCEVKTARLIDVRTRAEWSFVGVPDIGETGSKPVFIEWSSFPDMSVNTAFADEVEKAVRAEVPGPFLFLCRSGGRSLQAAHAVAAHYADKGVEVTCLNVAEGFEGDVDASGHRGSHNGWKARGAGLAPVITKEVTG